MLVKMQFKDRNGADITSIEFEHDAMENYIQLTDRTGSTIAVLDPLTDIVNVTLPTHSESSVPNPPDPEPPGPDKSACKPGDVFVEDANVTAEDQVNADALEANGYIPETRGTWGADQYITIGTYRFTMASDVWTPGTGA